MKYTRKYQEGGKIGNINFFAKYSLPKIGTIKKLDPILNNITRYSKYSGFKNIVDKQKYWDSLIDKYGKGVKGRQIYIDLYNRTLPETETNTNKYFPYTDDKYLPAELKSIKNKISKTSMAVNNFHSYINGYYTKEELDTLSRKERDKLFDKKLNELYDLHTKFEEHPLNRINVKENKTSWKV